MLEHKLWYSRPARNWDEALPIGNGALGGMIFGDMGKEHIQMNEESLWFGGYRDRHNPDAAKFLSQIRDLLWQGKMSEAEKLLEMSMFSIPEHQRQYSVLGDFYIQFYYPVDEKKKNYRRALDLETGISTVSYTVGEVDYKREYFCSYPDQVLVARITASKKGGLELSTYIDRGLYVDKLEVSEETSSMILTGKNGQPDGVDYAFKMQVYHKGGYLEVIGQRIYIRNCNEVMITLSAATSFKHLNPEEIVCQRLQKLEKQDYEVLLENHLKDYQKLMGAMTLDLKGEDLSYLSTDERLERMKQGNEDKNLVALYFQYGRYLLISCSRKGGLPANLQGIWNGQWQPPWSSKYTININTQMNYWPAEKCHLSECHLPLFDHLERMKIHGEETATKMYGCRGWVAHHNTDVWGDTAPQDMWLPGTIWPMGGAWLCLHIWEHYEYTEDIDFLKNKYHLLKDSGLFFKEYLMEDEKGYLVTGPSTSPENTYILPSGESGTVCIGPTMDNEILYELFSAIINAGKVVGESEEVVQEFEVLRSRLTPIQIGKHGQIMEWREDYEEKEPGHRHISQLFGLYPGTQISTNRTPDLAEAAKTTLNRRLKFGGGHTGWSRAWIINLWARLKDGELAYENVKELLKQSTLINLLDNHPPFQIDGNFGGTAGISEMLIQEDNEFIELLPAIPLAWGEGEVRGVCAKRGLILDFAWKEGKITKLILYSNQGGTYKIKLHHVLESVKNDTIYQIEEQAYVLEVNLIKNKKQMFGV
ncbi:MAG: glycoside hydrolase family 95 protein [Cellulosilyticum sp.]|nr:glycoside hydrolase family 95 protein [Cellulosilyticum sp.]